MSEPKKYGVETKVRFPLFAAGTNTFLAGATLAAGDATISKDDGAFAATTNTIVDEGNGFYSLTLTATEMEAANIMVSIRDAAGDEWENQGVLVHTYGHASAAMAFDFDQTMPTVEQIRAEMDSNSTQLAAIVEDTNELQGSQGNWVTATGFASAAAVAQVDTVVDGIATSVGALNNVSVANILDGVIEGTTTLKHSLQISNAVLAGIVTGADGLTISFRDLADSKNRVVTTADADNNRTGVVRSFD